MANKFEEPADRRELDIVIIDDFDVRNQYILCPLNASDRKLETAWIRAAEREFVSLTDMR